MPFRNVYGQIITQSFKFGISLWRWDIKMSSFRQSFLALMEPTPMLLYVCRRWCAWIRHVNTSNISISTVFFANLSPQYAAAVKTATMESTAKALSVLKDVLKTYPQLSVILKAPTLTQTDKSQFIRELQRHIDGPDTGGIVKNLLETLTENNRLGILGSLCNKFSVLRDAANGDLYLKVTSASVSDLLYQPLWCEILLINIRNLMQRPFSD